jgi:hypothetical protein
MTENIKADVSLSRTARRIFIAKIDSGRQPGALLGRLVEHVYLLGESRRRGRAASHALHGYENLQKLAKDRE